MIPGEYFLGNEDIELNEGRAGSTIIVVNTGDRPVQIGSHFHFFEINKELEFNRNKAYGLRLDIPAGTAVRFEPGEQKEVNLVAFSGNRQIFGFNNLVDGKLATQQASAIEAMRIRHFKNADL
jgi:urease beta subunit